MRIKNNVILFVILLLNTYFISLTHSASIKSNVEIQQGIIQSINSVFNLKEPNSLIINSTREKISHSHVPFSWLNYLKPTNWFDYIVITDNFSSILTDVVIKLNDGTTTTLSKVLIRKTDLYDESQIKKYIINRVENTQYDASTKIKSKLIFLEKKIKLINFTKKNTDNYEVVVAIIEIKSLSGILQNDGIYEFDETDPYTDFLNYGLLSYELMIK